MPVDIRRGHQPVSTDDNVAAEKLNAYPNLKQAARILNVSSTWLACHEDVKERAIQRASERVLPPDLLLELASRYRTRRLGAVASDLLDLAVKNAPEYVDEVEDEIDAALSALRAPVAIPDAAEFLRVAKRSLPPELYEQVERAYRAGAPDSESGD
jgi:hypothetical protein